MPAPDPVPPLDSQPSGDLPELRQGELDECVGPDAECKKISSTAPAEQPPPTAQRARTSREQFDRWQVLYQKQWRQIRRWIERGEAHDDPCPLNDPAKMPAWWSRNMKWRVPEEIDAAALAAAQSLPPPTVEAPLPFIPAPQSPPSAAEPQGKPIDLESFDPEEGDFLRELKQLRAAKSAQLRDALKSGEECSYLETKYLKLSETVDKIETRVTERLKKRGLYVLLAAVERDLAAAAELLRLNRVALERRILERCPSLTAEQRLEVSAAIATATAAEERMLCRLDTLDKNDLLKELAA